MRKLVTAMRSGGGEDGEMVFAHRASWEKGVRDLLRGEELTLDRPKVGRKRKAPEEQEEETDKVKLGCFEDGDFDKAITSIAV